ncbi:uncharacterized protein LOC119586665 [Penaeus monodon]|uniref:uncharacterized protein LOC119586665 n=1 Tax=Penaeus monodon TaxID=6687 RepID=UPI0018A76E04|nr:uncharacterized protein LOC119586665 [Penaeus monodon]
MSRTSSYFLSHPASVDASLRAESRFPRSDVDVRQSNIADQRLSPLLFALKTLQHAQRKHRPTRNRNRDLGIPENAAGIRKEGSAVLIQLTADARNIEKMLNACNKSWHPAQATEPNHRGIKVKGLGSRDMRRRKTTG